VLGFNLIPPVNLASLVMNGATVTAILFMLAVVAGWHAVQGRGDGRKALTSWALFGGLLGLGTLFCYPVGFLLPAALVAQLVMHGVKSFPWRGVTATLSLLVLGWVFPVAWNVRHDWIQWSSISPGFDALLLAGQSVSLGLVVVFCAMITPFLVWMAFARPIWRIFLIPSLLLFAMVSGIYLLLPGIIPPGLPSPLGLSGLRELSGEILSLRGSRPDAKGGQSFLIASTPGLAALLGSAIQIDYPERPGSPSVFAVESPSMSSSYALWPGYADAVAAGVKDPLYTEEKSVSPFLGRNALYITTESKEELPQTITGAFGAVGLLKEVPVTLSGRPVTLRIYQCEDYRTLSL
jgi:MFS family permease